MIQPQARLNHLMCQVLNWNPERGLGHLHLQVNKLRVRSSKGAHMAKVTKKAHMIVLFLMVQRHNYILIITLMTL